MAENEQTEELNEQPDAEQVEEAPVEADAPAEEPEAGETEPKEPEAGTDEVPAEAQVAEAEGPEEPEEPKAEAKAEGAEETEAAVEGEAPSVQPEPKKKRKRLPRQLRPQKTRPRRPASTGTRKPVVRQPKPDHERGRRQERRGVVVSSAMDKTIVVKVDVITSHQKYKKVIRRSVKFHAHDEENAAKVGDVVRIVETRPLSATKRWRLAEVVEAAK
jgi:small subunit ribosomal protein S17